MWRLLWPQCQPLFPSLALFLLLSLSRLLHFLDFRVYSHSDFPLFPIVWALAMAENLLPAASPPAWDHAGAAGCGSAATRACSGSSASAVDGSKACLSPTVDAGSDGDVLTVDHLIEYACVVSSLVYMPFYSLEYGLYLFLRAPGMVHFCQEKLVLPVFSKKKYFQGQATEWTDEKHNLYLDSLESSFVNRLHSSMGFFGWHSKVETWEINSFQEFAVNAYNSSDEYTVLQGGCWRKKNFGRYRLLSDAASKSRAMLENPWICHFKSAGQQHAITSSDSSNQTVNSRKGIHLRGKRNVSNGLATSSKYQSACHPWLQDSVCGITEVSDQNFVDEEQGKESSSGSMAKKLKTRMEVVDATTTDQCVTTRKLLSEADLPVSHTNLNKEKTGHAMNDNQKGLRVASLVHDVDTSLV